MQLNDDITLQYIQQNAEQLKTENTERLEFLFKDTTSFNFNDLVNCFAISHRAIFEYYAEEYISNRNNAVIPNFCTKELLPILENTAGLILYKQQVLEILMLVFQIDETLAKPIVRDLRKKNDLENIKGLFIQNENNYHYDDTYGEWLYDILVESSCYTFDRDYAFAKCSAFYFETYLQLHYPKNVNVNIKDDFYTFRNSVIEKYGEFYAEQSELFFERAVHFAEKKLHLTAIKEAEYAYALSIHETDSYRVIYLVGFLAQLHLDNNNIREAKAYCNLGFQLLDEESSEYENELRSYTELREMINGEDWKMNL